ncbi:hypothetical protein A8C56_15520 [Niabella ginsenosidivorans]|uniref:SusC/RagA family TonB-linked outer membrane protein n=1 Tax=Niabella ginsenosidivorans TaxID=1176587 RepID=A0A1A9I3D6_9BACT|nr:TonB-dependent receptor [Niabella ginsenosidivorans]ANH82187.1 hypothetical protein A8C56_15520 [Niabella ginsenosidivorans]
MRKIVLLTMLMAFSLLAFSQTRTIRGKITTPEGMPIPNVTILLGSNKTVGTTSDQNGDFSINAPSGESSLYVSAIGFKDQVVKISDKGTYTIALQPNTESNLEEVVVVGYGTQQRKDVTGAIGSIKGDAIQDLATPSFDKQLQGQVAGLQASVPSGILGQAARIRIRGTNSISSSSDPLYVVDGVPYISGNQGSATPYNPISDLNPSDIASIDVLKDGAATAIYGSRAANGVILITTKRGKTGKPTVTYDGWIATARASKKFDLLNADQFIEIANEKLTNYGEDGPAHASADGTNTDWQDIILRNAFQQSHALSLSGATDQTNYFLSLGYVNMDGISVSNNLIKYNIRAKVEQKALNNALTLGANIAVNYNINNGLNTGSSALSGNITGALRLPPNVSPFNADGSYNLSPSGTLGAGPNDQTVDDNYTNLAYVLANNVFRSQALNINGNSFARLKLFDGFNISTQIGVNYINTEDFWYYNPVHGDGRGSNGIVDQAFSPTFRYNWQNTIDYSKKVQEHLFNIVVGQELQKTRYRYLEGSGTDLSDVYFGQQGNIISSTLANQFYGGSVSENAFLSYFGRLNYSYADKYLVSASLRHDKLSALPWGNQSATLPGVSVGWRLSKENFFSGASNIFNDAKIRASYAEVGNVDIGNYPYAGLFGPVQYGDWSGVQYSNMGNPDLKFETSRKWDVGLDLSFLHRKVQLVVDYFYNNVDNLILSVPTAPSLGVPGNSYSANVGKMTNKGWEFTVNSVNIDNGSFRWNTAFNVSFIKNKVIELVDNKDIINTYNITRVGLPIGSFYGYQAAGVNTQNGNPIFQKADGSFVQYDGSDDPHYGFFVYDPSNPTDESTSSTLSASDKRVLGQPNPKWYGGLTNNFYYKGFDLGIVLTFAGGNKIYNITRQETLLNQKFQNNGTEILKRWTTVGQVTDVPKLWYFEDNNMNSNGNLNSRFLEKGDYLRGQTIALGYSFNTKHFSNVINTLRIYIQAQNAFVITGYSGLDPELANSVTTNQTPGLDYNTNPVPRTFSFGLNVNF